MMKYSLLYFLIMMILFGCNENANSKKISHAEKLEIEAKRNVSSMVDSIKKQSALKVLFDTVGVSTGPIKVLSAKLYSEEYSNYRDISIRVKNVSSKQIVGVRFRWFGENIFGEPADMGGISIMSGAEGFGGGFGERIINPNKTTTLEWDINSKDGKKVIKAWPTEVVFSDGSKWKSSSN